MKILIISPNYPTAFHSKYIFVKQLVDVFIRQGHECVVIAPSKIFQGTKGYCYEEKQNIGNNHVIIYRPKYLSVSDIKLFGRHLSSVTFQQAVNNTIKSIDFVPDVIYGHFWPSAVAGLKFAKSNNLPIFVATGESNIRMIFQDINHSGRLCKDIDGVICVSTKNKLESIELGLTTEDKCGIFPNAIDNTLFYKTDRIRARKQLGLPLDKFIVAFVGSFKYSKGPDRVSKAIDSIPEKDVYSIFIGGGALTPTCENILYKGMILHEQIPQYLNAADVFVLPTLAEGCCNAIIEAMACGLPIVSSNLPFNWDVLDENNAILINPNNIEEIASAICYMRDNKKERERLSQNSLLKAQKLSIDRRAKRIVDFLIERSHKK